MMFALALGLLSIAAFALLMMNITKTIPFRLPWGRVRQDEDPEGFRRYLFVYAVMAAVGAVLLLAHYSNG